MLAVFSAYIRPILEFASPVWNTGYLGDLRLLERVQRTWTKQILGLENMPYAERLAALDLYSVKGRLLRADLILVWKIFHGHSPIQPEELFSLDVRPGNRGHPFKIHRVFVGTELRRRFLSNRCAPVWNGLPTNVVTASTVGSFKRGLHSALGDQLFDFVA